MDKSKSQMTKEEITDLLSLFTLIAVSKNGEDEFQRLGITEEQADKMLRVSVNLFDNDEKKAEEFIRNKVIELLAKLDAHDDSECQINNFKGVN